MLSEWETGTKWRCKSGQRIPPPCLSYKILFLSGCSSHLTQLHPSVYHPPTDWVKEFNQSSARRISLLLFHLPARWSTYFTTAEAAYNISQYFWFGSTSFHNNSSPGLHYFFLNYKQCMVEYDFSWFFTILALLIFITTILLINVWPVSYRNGF